MNTIETAFTGRIGQEPVLKESKSGKPWLSFSVAVGEDENTQWVSVAVFGSRAEELAGSLKKGDRIYAEGRLRLNSWQAKDGSQQCGLSVAAWRVEVLGQIGAKRPRRPKATASRAEVFAPLGSAESSAQQLNDPIPF
jgi:single-strand DNA-binding protein